MDLPPKRTRRLIVVGMLAAAAAIFATAIIVYAGNPSSSELPVAIQSTSPEAGDDVLSQSDITVDLAVGYTAELELNGRPIPETELVRVDGLNQVTYRPGFAGAPGLLANQNCVRVTYWLIAVGPDDSKVHTFCFFST